jgi:iron complex outermembrane recepter protein
MNYRRNSRALAVASLWVALTATPAALSDETSANKNEPKASQAQRSTAQMYEEIVVTAQKRSQSVQDVPVSVSVLDQRLMEKRSIDEFSDFARLVPSLSFQDQGASQGQIAMRGIASAPVAGDEPNSKESVGIYFGEVPVATSRFNPDLNLFDIERVEALRGPQGTLYGAGSLSGTIKIMPNQPDASEFSAAVDSSVSSTRNGGVNYGVNAMVNIPVVEDTFALRAVLSSRFDDGFVDNIARDEPHANDEQISTARLTGKYWVTDQLTMTGMLIYQDSDTDGFPSNDTLVGGADIGLNELEQSRATEEGITDEFVLYNLVVEYEFDSFQILSSTSLWDRDITFDIDLTSGLDLAFGSFGLQYPLNDTTELQDIVEEVRFTSTGDGPFHWIGGVYFQKQERVYQQSIPVEGYSDATGTDTEAVGSFDNIFESKLSFDEEQVAVFGELSYDLTDKLTATAGLRWFDVTQDFTISAQGVLNGGFTLPRSVTASEDGYNPKFLLSYEVSDDVLVSAIASRGFRLGGTNDVIPVSVCADDLSALGLTKGPESFESESLWNYEVNAKSAFADNRVILNAAVFFIEYEDIQATRRLNCGYGYTDNAGTAESKGVEFELITSLMEGLDFTFGGNYVDAHLTSSDTIVGEKGDRLPLHPRVSLNASIQYGFDLTSEWYTYVGYDHQYTGEIVSVLGYRDDTTLPQPLDDYSTGAIRIGAERGDFEAVVSVTNVWDERAELFERSFFGDLQRFKFRNQPRTVGLTVRTRF